MEPFTDYPLIDGISDENINNGIDFWKKFFAFFLLYVTMSRKSGGGKE